MVARLAVPGLGVAVLYATRSRGVNKALLVTTLATWLATVGVSGVASERFTGRPLSAILIGSFQLAAVATICFRISPRSK